MYVNYMHDMMLLYGRVFRYHPEYEEIIGTISWTEQIQQTRLALQKKFEDGFDDELWTTTMKKY